MKETLRFIYLSLAVLLFAAESPSQFLSKDGEPPTDLEITLTSKDGREFGQNSYHCRITADGRVFSEDRQHKLAWARASWLIVSQPNNKENRKPQLPVKDRLSKGQLAQMVSEFEKAEFLRMENDYFGSPEQRGASCSGQGGIISMSIIASGWHKKVTFYIGCPYADRTPHLKFWSVYDKILIPLRGIKFVEGKKEVPNFIID